MSTFFFRSPYIHTADSGPSAIVYYPLRHQENSATTSTFQPIYESIGNPTSQSSSFQPQVQPLQPQKLPQEPKQQPRQSLQDIYSQVSKKGNGNATAGKIVESKEKPGEASAASEAGSEVKQCDDNAALERLSQLLTGSEQETGKALSTLTGLSSADDEQEHDPIMPLIKLTPTTAAAPIAKPEDSLAGSTLASEDGETAASNRGHEASSQIFRELDDAFTSLDKELEADTSEPEVGTKTTAATGNGEKDSRATNGRIVSAAPTAI